MDVREVIDHCGDIIVRARYDSTYDKNSLPDEFIVASYCSPGTARSSAWSSSSTSPPRTEQPSQRGAEVINGAPKICCLTAHWLSIMASMDL